MDKTLGLANVVTEENFPALWQEMLHPHLEEEREKGKAALAAERVAARKKIEEERGKLSDLETKSQIEKTQLIAKLESSRSEDKSAVEGLCTEVGIKIYRHRIGRILLGALIAVAFSIPMLLETTPLVRWVSFIFGIMMAFLTATGGRFVTLETTASKAISILNGVARQRYLANKVSQFEVTWDGSKFHVSDLPELSSITERTGLFPEQQ